MPANPAIRTIMVHGLVTFVNLFDLSLMLDFFRVESAIIRIVQ